MEQTEFSTAKKLRTAHLSQLTKLYNELDRQMMSIKNSEKVKQLYDRICEKYELFEAAHLQCLDLWEDSCSFNVEVLETNFISQQKNFAECKERYTEWLKQLKTAADDNVSVSTRESSARSSRSQLRSAKATRLIAEHRLQILKEKQRIEREERELENEQQLLQQQSEIEEAKIEESVWEGINEEDEGPAQKRSLETSDMVSRYARDRGQRISDGNNNNGIPTSGNVKLRQQTYGTTDGFIRDVSNDRRPTSGSDSGVPKATEHGLVNAPVDPMNDNDLASCQKFTTFNLAERRKHVIKFKLCYNCLKGNHVASKCRKPKLCTVTDCTGKHHLLLHSWVQSGSDHTVTQPSVNCAATNGAFVKTCLGIVPVTVVGGYGYSCQTYALLDDGADKTLCDERLIQKLHVPCRPVTFEISTVSSTGSTTQGQEVDLRVRPISGEGEVCLHKVWSVKRLPISRRSAATADDIRKISYLSDLDIPHVDASDVTLLIGTDSPDAHIPLEVRTGDSSQPYAVRTRLGWTVRGPIPESHDTNRIEPVNIHFGQSSDVMLQQQLERMWSSDFSDKTAQEKCSMSVEDKRALDIMESTLTFESGHYIMGLPWRNGKTTLPNNLVLAQARLEQLKRKLSRDTELHDMYTKTVTDYLDKGYAKEVIDKESDSKRIWYLPHHPVTNVNKPGKVRVVFDCAAKYKDVSLNSQLLQGPDMMNSLVGVLTRFRQEKIALAADIQAMFHQVRVREEDCDALRFLWWAGGDMTQKPKTYCMQVHLFGATSSPSCAAYALRRTASDNIDRFRPEVVSTVSRNFYVDDCLKSVASEKEAIKLAADLRSLIGLGGFRLTKWLSNSRYVFSAIPESDRAPSVVSLEPGDLLPYDRALGVSWNVNDDKITFKVKYAEKPLTRRGILSVVSSIYDPLGLVSPVTLRAKAIVQNLCRKRIGWDDAVPQRECEEWKRWIANLPRLENTSVNLSFRPSHFGEIKNIQLHVFSDGSETGYGACAYLRMVDEHNRITCSLVLGKSRLAPIKNVFIPRLELSGAVVACRLYAMLSEELDLKIDHVVFWTDSTILLGYINKKCL